MLALNLGGLLSMGGGGELLDLMSDLKLSDLKLSDLEWPPLD